MGNGGYTSLHTDVHLVYDAPSNQFLPGNQVVLTDRATQCLSDFSLDLERSSVLAVDGPDLTVQAVTVNGDPASFRFVQPTYPGDPLGQDDPDPLAHQASQVTPVGGPTTTRSRPPAPRSSPGTTSTRRTASPVPPPSSWSRRSSRCPTVRSSTSPSPTPAGRECISTATARPRAGSAPTTRPATVGS